jgi:hypothetical protein
MNILNSCNHSDIDLLAILPKSTDIFNPFFIQILFFYLKIINGDNKDSDQISTRKISKKGLLHPFFILTSS